jgi:hypothetical protein
MKLMLGGRRNPSNSMCAPQTKPVQANRYATRPTKLDTSRKVPDRYPHPTSATAFNYFSKNMKPFPGFRPAFIFAAELKMMLLRTWNTLST